MRNHLLRSANFKKKFIFQKFGKSEKRKKIIFRTAKISLETISHNVPFLETKKKENYIARSA